MSVLREIEAQILGLIARGQKPRRVHVPMYFRDELALEMRRVRPGRITSDMPLHIMGVLLNFEGDSIQFDLDG